VYWIRSDGLGEAQRLTQGKTLEVPYSFSPDGKRLAVFVADDANGEKPITHLTFLLNFFDDLRRKMPIGK